jgi:hypothetical protein
MPISIRWESGESWCLSECVGKRKISIPAEQQTLRVQPIKSLYYNLQSRLSFSSQLHNLSLSQIIHYFNSSLPPDFVTWFVIKCDEVVSTVVVKRAEGISYLKAKLWGEVSIFHYLKRTLYNYNYMMAWENVYTLNFPENIISIISQWWMLCHYGITNGDLEVRVPTCPVNYRCEETR